MIRVLLKKQLTEIFRGYFVNQKKKTVRSKFSTGLFFVLFAVVMLGVLGGMFYTVAKKLCVPLNAVGVGWLYFSIMGILGVIMGTFGSVFNTYSGLYLGKDNDLLLSMPIPIRYILAARLLGVYLIGLLYGSMAVLPALIVYWVNISFSAKALICGLIWLLLISVIILILSCILGWAVAKLSLKLKGKSYVTVLLSLAFIGIYYFFFFRAQALLQKLLANAVFYGEKIKGSAKVIYYFGLAGKGSWKELLLVSAAILGLFALTYWVLSRTFLNIATSEASVKKIVYREKNVRAGSLESALLRREFLRFGKCAAYMLNCGIGVLFIAASGIFLLLRGETVLKLLVLVLADRAGAVPVMLCGLLGMMSASVIVAAPSVSLEGKTVWQLQCLPLTAWQALRAKLRMQLILCTLPTIVAAVCAALVCPGTTLTKLLLALATTLYSVFFSLLCLFFGVLLPNLNWTSEITPIKQGGSVLLSMLGGMGVCAVFVGAFFVFNTRPDVYLAVESAFYALGSVFFYCWLRTKGARRFESLI